MACLYRHIRLDKNVPFYIGIGNKDRPYRKNKRNKIWNDIINKTDYKIEILFEDLTWEEACEKEKEFILLYGRIDLKTGTLSNMTEGGEGTTGIVRDDIFKIKQSINKKELFKDKTNHPTFGKTRPDADKLKTRAIGRKWYTNGNIDKMCYPGEESIGFKLGRIIKNKNKK